jgi:hypothetical protein
MKLITIVATLALSLVSLTSPGSAEACGGYGADQPADWLPNDTAAIGTATSVAGTTLYLDAPRRPGDREMALYGGYFDVVRDARFERLVKRLAAGEQPEVRIGRKRPGDPWRVVSISKRSR